MFRAIRSGRLVAGRRLLAASAIASMVVLLTAGTAFGASNVVTLTPTLNFGEAVVGSPTITRYLSLYNAGGASEGLFSLTSAGGDQFPLGFIGSCPDYGNTSLLSPGGSCQFGVDYRPSIYGSVSDTITASFCAPSGNSCTVDTSPSIVVEGIGVPVDDVTLSATKLSFASQALDTLSQGQTVTLTNGVDTLPVTGLVLGGSDPGEFLITQDHCTGRTLDPAATCTFNVRSAPDATGPLSATLQVEGAIAGNTFPSLALAGVGGQLPTGPVGATGPAGATGPRGPAGSIDLVTCRTVKRTVGRRGHRHTVKRRICTARNVAGPVKFITTGPRMIEARLVAHRVVYAQGVRRGRRLVLRVRRPLRAGRYTLVVVRLSHGHRRTERRTVTVG